MSRYTTLVLACASLAVSVSASAATFAESEANDTKSTANPVAFTAPGDTITGLSTGTSTTVAGVGSADNFLISLPAQPFGIYRNRLTITTNGTAGHTGSLRGLTQTATGTNSTGPGTINAGTDSAIQSSSSTTTPARFNQFYSSGAPTSLIYRVTGGTTTTVDYTSTWSQDVVTPTDLGSFKQGSFTITNLGLASTQDTEIFLLNSALSPIAFNDDALDAANGGPVVPATSSTLNSYLQTTLTPGVYYLAVSNFNTATSDASTANEGTANGGVLDFPGIISNSSTAALASIPLSITSVDGTASITASKPGAYDVWFGKLTVTVVPEPTSLSALAAVALLTRRCR